MAIEKLAGIGGGAANGIAFLVSAGIVAEIVAKACSSPQTTQLNAHRAPTLMKWVTIGMLEAALFVGLAAWFDPAHRVAIIAGGLLEGGITYAEYWHAREASMASSEPGTESPPPASGGAGCAKGAAW